MAELEKVIRGLRDIDMFITGRLGYEKAKNFLRTIDETIALLKEQEEQIKNRDESLEKAREEIKWLRGMLKEQETVTIKKTKEPYGYGVYGGICPKCSNWIQSAHSFCGFCGKAVKWE